MRTKRIVTVGVFALLLLNITCNGVWAVTELPKDQIVESSDSKSDGISREKAESIAEAYLVEIRQDIEHGLETSDKGDYWEVQPRFGYAGTPGKETFHIDKKSGNLTVHDRLSGKDVHADKA